jgi:FkbM family methyltransferase
VQEQYSFSAKRRAPIILDCGANIGLTSIYWNRTYPHAHTTAFEPDPGVFDALAWNIKALGLDHVDPVQRAVWTGHTELGFWADGADGGRLLHPGTGVDRFRPVKTVRLRDYLSGEIDLLKVDIEGAEVDVLLDCADRLNAVHHLLVEYHSFLDQRQRLADLLPRRPGWLASGCISFPRGCRANRFGRGPSIPGWIFSSAPSPIGRKRRAQSAHAYRRRKP